MKYLDVAVQARWSTGGEVPAFPGSAFRGTFGHAFKEAVCVRGGKCGACHLRYECAYSVIFETPTPEGADWIARYPNATHPFVLRVPRGGAVEAGQEFTLGFRLFGGATGLLPQFLYAIFRQGERGLGAARVKFEVASAREASGHVIYQAPSEAVLMPRQLPELAPLAARPAGGMGSALVEFLSPCKLVLDGHVLGRWEPRAVVGSILRRWSMLEAYHGDGPPPIDFRAWAGAAVAEIDAIAQIDAVRVGRWSNRQERHMEFHGITGRVELRRCPRAMLEILAVGEAIHVGKATAFGFGEIRVTNREVTT